MAPNNNTCTVCGLDSSSFIDKRSFRNHVDKHLGVECNKLYHYLEENCPSVQPFSKKMGIVRDPFNNKDYNGNYCEKILKNVDSLKDIVDAKYQPIIEGLQALKDVKKHVLDLSSKKTWKTSTE